ncbi:hypothetical protein G3I59_38570 [Amycolatopsis rubida]|uniref:Uncharacterized protein n=1 Tax=Amycolatopsis rubida TaxID=112413 RepID=A0ABX0C113_9PSEU|nr:MULTISPECIES: hypothetical protein [Amycolatopsis]MYW96361.1 hypothetical protein [Amycolatopsis rubida]NEC61351.1 hypothetical protein [Amycolatopsis rubida]
MRRCLASGTGPAAVDDPVSDTFLIVVPRSASYAFLVAVPRRASYAFLVAVPRRASYAFLVAVPRRASDAFLVVVPRRASDAFLVVVPRRASYAFLVAVPRPASYGPARAWLSGIGSNPLRQHARGRYRRMTACDHGPQVVDGLDGPVAGLADAQARVRELADLAPGGGAGRWGRAGCGRNQCGTRHSRGHRPFPGRTGSGGWFDPGPRAVRKEGAAMTVDNVRRLWTNDEPEEALNSLRAEELADQRALAAANDALLDDALLDAGALDQRKERACA